MFNYVLKILREESNLTQDQLAQKLNVSRSTVSHWENSTSAPTLEALVDIANLFDVSVDVLLGRFKNIKNIEDIKRIPDDRLRLYLEDCIKVYYKHIK